jgi:low molecular weight phosphotyrosine protein phosphatase
MICLLGLGLDWVWAWIGFGFGLGLDWVWIGFGIGLDWGWIDQIQERRPANSRAIIQLLGSFDPEGELIINDPYYGGTDGFVYNFNQIARCCNALLDQYN